MASDFADSLFENCQKNKSACSRIATVAIDSGVEGVFDYLLADDLNVSVGCRVKVPFGRANKITGAVCVDIQDKDEKQKKRKLKYIKNIIDAQPILNETQLKFGKWLSDYYICPLGQVYSAMLPAAVKKGIGVKQVKQLYLAGGNLQPVRSKKQKAVIEFLKISAAFNTDSAVDIDTVCKDCGCGKAVVKNLLQAGILKISSQPFIKELPMIPEGMQLKTDKPVVLNDEQSKAVEKISDCINAEKFSAVLLHGVTDSGKTEVYIRCIEKIISMGKSAIVLLPEIALTAQTVQRLSSRFRNVALMHSQLSASQRNAQWQKISRSESIVVIGARSALFTPVNNLGVIVVDEEHEPSYKQDSSPRYHGRDCAVKLAQITDSVCILGSATPSLETLYNCEVRKHFIKLDLPRRVMALAKPEIEIVSMLDEKRTAAANSCDLLSEKLIVSLRNTLIKKEQAILLLNRRGYSNFVFCPSCRYTLKCRNCDVNLTFHKSKKISANLAGRMKGGCAICHYCQSQVLVPKICPVCGKNLVMFGLGSQRLEEQLQKKFPDVKIVRLDSDSVQGRDYYKLLADFDAGKIDVLLGTQILAKGLHFPNVTLVGIISADTCLQIPDFRANERTYQLICQVAGRTARSKKGGRVLVQSFMPTQPAIVYAVADDFKGFVAEELGHRKNCNLPPYGRLAIMRFRDVNYQRLEKSAAAVFEQLNALVSDDSSGVIVSQPCDCTIARVQRFHRKQIMLQAGDAGRLTAVLNRWRYLKKPFSGTEVQIDVDAVNIL